MNKQQTTLDLLVSANPTDAMMMAAEHNRFYADATQLLCGDYAISGTDNDAGQPVAVVYATQAEAEAEIADMQAEYQRQIDAGERDADDEWDAIVVSVTVEEDGRLTLSELDSSDDLLHSRTQTMDDLIGQ
jgi:hypothetical protein